MIIVHILRLKTQGTEACLKLCIVCQNVVRRRFGRFLRQMVAVQKIDNVRENRRCNIVKQRAQALCLVFCKVPDDRGRAEAVEVPGVGLLSCVKRARRIFAPAVHADIQQPLHGRCFRERQKLLRKPSIARDEFHTIPSFFFILSEIADGCNKTSEKILPHPKMWQDFRNIIG